MRFRKHITVPSVLMAIGLIAFLLTPLFIGLWGIDTDIVGLIIFAFGLALYLRGIIRTKKVSGWKLIVLYLSIGALCLPALMLMMSVIYFLITGKALG